MLSMSSSVRSVSFLFCSWISRMARFKIFHGTTSLLHSLITSSSGPYSVIWIGVPSFFDIGISYSCLFNPFPPYSLNMGETQRGLLGGGRKVDHARQLLAINVVYAVRDAVRNRPGQ